MVNFLKGKKEADGLNANVSTTKSQTILVLELRSNGDVSEISEVTPRQLYSYIKLNVATFAESSERGLEGLSGEPLNMRDIRKLQQPFATKNQPAIIVRLFAILLNFDPLRAIILSDRMIVLLPSGADGILDQLSSTLFENLSQLTQDGGEEEEEEEEEGHSKCRGEFETSNTNNTFVFKAVESVISVVVANIEDDLDIVSRKVAHILKVFETERSKVSFKTLSSLKSLKNDVATEEARALMTRQALDEILSEDEDLALLGFATSPKQAVRDTFLASSGDPAGFRRTVPLSLTDCTLLNGVIPTHCINVNQHEAFEILFENMLQAVITVQTSVSLLRTEIANGEQFHMLHLTTARNQLLSASVGFSIISMFTAVGSFVASIFGMNLSNGFENSDIAFEVVASTSAFLITCLTLLVFVGLRWSGVLYASPSSP